MIDGSLVKAENRLAKTGPSGGSPPTRAWQRVSHTVAPHTGIPHLGRVPALPQTNASPWQEDPIRKRLNL